jgi:MFS family permease
VSWYRDLNPPQRKAFWGCFGGWALDAMDVQMYALVLPVLIATWGMTKVQGGTLGTAALLASSVGGAIAGNLADRFGRVRILQVSILWFSFFTFASGFTHSYGQLFVARTLQGVGFGGEWAAGAVLMAETIGAKDRGKVLAAVSSGWAVGYGAAAILFGIVFHFVQAAIAWRILFGIGILPAALILFIRRNIVEPEIYTSTRAASVDSPLFTEIFYPPILRRTVTAWGVCLGVLGGNYTVLTWLPTYLQLERHLSYKNTGLYLLVNIFGSFLGYVIGGNISDWLGRRWSLAVFALLGICSVYSYILIGGSSLAVMLLGFPLGFAQSAMNAGVAPLLSELFPTRLRATGQGFCYNMGRGIGTFFPTLVGLMAARTGLTVAISLAASSAYVLVLILSFVLPETSHQQLDAIDLVKVGQ